MAETFYRLGTEARHILRIADHFYQVYRKDEDYLWAPIGELEDLENHLAEPARVLLGELLRRLGRLAPGDGGIGRRRHHVPAVAGRVGGGHGGRRRRHRRAAHHALVFH